MIRNYVKTALRSLLKDKTYAILNIAGLALGLACGLLIYLFVQFHWRTDAFHAKANRIYRVVLDIHSKDGSVEHEPGVSIAIPEALQNHFAAIENTASLMYLKEPTLQIQRAGREPERFIERAGVAYASAGLVEMFDYQFVKGAPSTALREPGSVVLTERQAQKYFGSDDALGKTIRINNAADLKVTGLIRNFPANSDLKAEVLISLPTLKTLNPSYEMQNLTWIGGARSVFVQLPEGVDHQAVETQLPQFVDKYLGKQNFSHWHFHLQPLRDMHFDERYGGEIRKPLLWALSLIGLFLIGIACINFINLSTAQALRRAKEVGVRKTLGGAKSQIFWQFITEAACLVLVAALVAIPIITQVLPLLNDWMNSTLTLNFADPELLIFLLALVITVILLAGSYPAIFLARFSPLWAMKSKISGQKVGGFSVRKILVVAQFSVSQAFIIGAVVVMTQMNYFQKADMGFDQDAIVRVRIPGSNSDKRAPFRDELLQNPSFQAVSFHALPPADNANNGGYVKFNQRAEFEPFLVQDRWGDANYLDLYGLRLVAGRNFVERDSVTEFIVNEEFVKSLGVRRPEEVLGKRLQSDNTGQEGTIVGVVRNFHQKSLQNPIEPCVIYSFPQLHNQAGIRLNTTDLAASLEKIQATLKNTFPDTAFSYEFVNERIAKLYEKEQTLGQLTRLFTLIATIICCLGLFGLVRFMAAQKTKEIGVRKVLGATNGDILWLFGKEFLALVVISFLIAAPLAGWLMNGWLQGFAYRISLHGWIFALTGLIALVLVLVTVGLQSWRAATMNPVKSLSRD